MRVDNSAAGMSILAACTTDVKQWYMQNELQLNPDKSEALLMGTATQLRAVSSLTSVSVADVDLPVADSMRVIGVTFDRRRSAIMQLPRACDPPHTPSTHFCAARRSIQHHSEAPANPQQHGAYRSTSASTVRRQLGAPDAALAAC